VGGDKLEGFPIVGIEGFEYLRSMTIRDTQKTVPTGLSALPPDGPAMLKSVSAISAETTIETPLYLHQLFWLFINFDIMRSKSSSHDNSASILITDRNFVISNIELAGRITLVGKSAEQIGITSTLGFLYL